MNDVLSAVRAAILGGAAAAGSANLRKDWVQPSSATSGINYYDLEAPSKKLYPVITPLRNRIPRVKAMGGIQANWRAITAINTGGTRAGVGQGNRGGVVATTVADYIAAYRSLGLEDFVTFEADLAAQQFEDVKALAVMGLLNSLMIEEENILLGGNNSLALGTTPTPSLSTATTGGTLVNQTWSVICVALTLDGFRNARVDATGVLAAVTRTNTDGSQDTYGAGSAQKSANATIATTGTTSTISATVALVGGAIAYAWYLGTAGSERLHSITTINSALFTAAAGGANQLASALPASDNSRNLLIHDGLFPMVQSSAYGGKLTQLATGVAGTGTPLTSDNAGGINEIDAMLLYFWDVLRLSPTDIYVSSQEMDSIGKKVLGSTSNFAQRFSFVYTNQGALAGGIMIKSYLNKFGMNGAQEIPIHLHPNLPPGTMLFYTQNLPYPLSNVTNVLQVRTRRDYHQLEWPLRTRKYEYGVYSDQVLQNFFPPAFGMITNIAKG
jgi:hypothetical protein